jgi:PAS domain S-box-containing protein
MLATRGKNTINFPLLAVLATLALAGNIISYPLFFGVDFLFGSIAVLVALTVVNTRCGTMVAAVAGVYTYFKWGHPYALIIFSLEALVVGYLLKERIKNLVLADLFYWAIIGAPLVWLFYSQFLGMQDNQVYLIMMKQPINGVFNAVSASFILAVSLHNPWMRKQLTDVFISARELMFNLSFSGVFIAVLAVVAITNKVELESLQSSLDNKFRFHSTVLSEQLDEHGEITTTEQLVRAAGLRASDTELGLVLLDKQKNILLTTNNELPALFTDGTTVQVSPTLSQWLPPREKQALMLWWTSSWYYYHGKLNRHGVAEYILMQPANYLIRDLQSAQIKTFALLIVVTFIGAIIAIVLSNFFSSPLMQLSAITNSLPTQIPNRSKVSWPQSPLFEVNELSRHSESMANQLGKALARLQDTNLALEEQATAIINNAHEGIMHVDSNGVILSANPACEIIFGYMQNELQGRSISILTDPAKCHLNQAFLTDNANIGRLINCIGKKRTGESFPLEFLVTEMKAADNTSFSFFLKDVSDREQAENTKNQFLSTVSHELRTPLSAITGAVRIINGLEKDKLSEQGQDMLRISINNAERLTRIVNDLLDMQKILHEGGITYDIQTFELIPVVEESIESNAALLHSRGLSIKSHFNADNLLVEVDKMRLIQAITNLISNAAKFSQTGDCISVSVEPHGNIVRITVGDTGSGIPDEFQETIFERFTQADSSDTRSHGGTGLGLNITKSIIERFNGTIWFDSTQGVGTQFHIDLPYTRTADD